MAPSSRSAPPGRRYWAGEADRPRVRSELQATFGALLSGLFHGRSGARPACSTADETTVVAAGTLSTVGSCAPGVAHENPGRSRLVRGRRRTGGAVLRSRWFPSSPVAGGWGGWRGAGPGPHPVTPAGTGNLPAGLHGSAELRTARRRPPDRPGGSARLDELARAPAGRTRSTWCRRARCALRSTAGWKPPASPADLGDRRVDA
ncbi:hypothetical protein HBB16_10935 [Pseudonocardia sp. MCCB 268]|nr:hypothetical protein [Pseudonocardia cytotoxica]